MALLNKMNWESFKEDLLGSDPQRALKAATDLSERIEIVHSTEYPALLREGLPAFTTLLQRKCTPDDPLRKCVLGILSRLPNNEILRKHAPHLLQIAMDVLQHDFEENALLASRIIFDLHKHFRSMQEQVQPYLDFVQASYKALPDSIERNFAPTLESTPTSISNESVTSTNSVSSSSSSSSPLPSLSSFRVLTECPLTVMLLFQLYPKFLKANIPSLISLMMDSLGLRAPQPSSTQPNRRDHYSRYRETRRSPSEDFIIFDVPPSWVWSGYAHLRRPPCCQCCGLDANLSPRSPIHTQGTFGGDSPYSSNRISQGIFCVHGSTFGRSNLDGPSIFMRKSTTTWLLNVGRFWYIMSELY